MSTNAKEFQYSSEFIEKVKQELPNAKELYLALDSGSHSVGRLISAEAEHIYELHSLWQMEISANIA